MHGKRQFSMLKNVSHHNLGTVCKASAKCLPTYKIMLLTLTCHVCPSHCHLGQELSSHVNGLWCPARMNPG